MRIIIKPLAVDQGPIDVTNLLVGAIAEELWLRFGGNGALNWLEAERHLAAILGFEEEGEEEAAGSGIVPRSRASKG